MNFKPEWILMPIYIVGFLFYLWKGETGKTFYWLGVVILNYGLMRMNGRATTNGFGSSSGLASVLQFKSASFC